MSPAGQRGWQNSNSNWNIMLGLSTVMPMGRIVTTSQSSSNVGTLQWQPRLDQAVLEVEADTAITAIQIPGTILAHQQILM